MTPLPKLEELFDFKDMNPVLKACLSKLESPYGYWYPVDDKGVMDHAKTRAYFLGIQKELGGDDLAGLMPPMCHQPVKGSEPYMLATAYDPQAHERVGFKDEEDFKKKRLPLGSTHGGIRTFESDTLFGGLESNFDPSSTIKSPFYAGRSCTVRSSVKIIGPSALGDKTMLNTSAVFTRSILGSRSQVDDQTTVKDSLIGSRVFIMTGARLLHVNDLEGSKIEVRDYREALPSAELIVTGRLKMGCVIGDDCVIGANAVLGPGTILLPGCNVPNGFVLPSGIYDQQVIYALEQERW